jgi:hypothetical protein
MWYVPPPGISPQRHIWIVFPQVKHFAIDTSMITFLGMFTSPLYFENKANLPLDTTLPSCPNFQFDFVIDDV